MIFKIFVETLLSLLNTIYMAVLQSSEKHSVNKYTLNIRNFTLFKGQYASENYTIMQIFTRDKPGNDKHDIAMCTLIAFYCCEY